MGKYMDCGCWFDDKGKRSWCPSCVDLSANSNIAKLFSQGQTATSKCWVYKQTEPGLWTVGHFDPSGNWYTDSDHDSRREASERVAILNGSNVDEVCRLKLKVDDLEAEVQDQKQVRRWLENAIRAFAVPHMKLDDEKTPGNQYDDLMRDWTVAAHGLVDVYMALEISEEN